jgi:hypothetical protein
LVHTVCIKLVLQLCFNPLQVYRRGESSPPKRASTRTLALPFRAVIPLVLQVQSHLGR